jgi:hypothetical protein
MVALYSCLAIYLLTVFTGIVCFACRAYTNPATLLFHATCVLLSLLCPPFAMLPIQQCV